MDSTTIKVTGDQSPGNNKMPSHSRIPITIITGFAGSGKTTLILNLLPQLRAENPGYTLALIKNEIGDLAVDTQLAAAAELAASKELLGACICCTNIGQIEENLEQLAEDVKPDRIIIETSGSAEPLKLVLEVNRVAKLTGKFELDGIVSVVDAENWNGYASQSYTAKLQAKQTDMIVINKWESLGEREFDLFLDKLGELDVETPQVKSNKGVLPADLLFGLDGKMLRGWLDGAKGGHEGHDHKEGEKCDQQYHHSSEVECVSVTLTSDSKGAGVDLKRLEQMLRAAPKDEVYRIKAVLYANSSPKASDGEVVNENAQGRSRYILNWSFGRWTWSHNEGEAGDADAPVLRMSIFTAPYESTKWTKKVESGNFVALADGAEGKLEAKKVQ
ncbi:unnamed protein product [Zymoseptoria tritici ST99CH_1E4]|nr:unnamed protein product [Zymoseptoria tritici ST99CH_1E4]